MHCARLTIYERNVSHTLGRSKGYAPGKMDSDGGQCFCQALDP